MRTNYQLFWPAVAASFLLAIAPMNAPAQERPGTSGPAFYIAEFELTDPDGIKPYSSRVQATLAPFGGRFIVRGGGVAPLEGEPPKRMVVIAFDSVRQAQAWYDSPAYTEIRPIRQRSAKTRAYIVEGLPPFAGATK